MRTVILLGALGALGALAACTGAVGEEEESSGAAGKGAYTSTVSSMMRSQCSSCHEGAGSGPAFLGATGGDDDYTAILSNARIVGGFEPANALVLTKGAHAGAQWWSSTQTTTITDWLLKEREEFGDGGVPDLMAAWAGCMTIENWNDSKMALWAAKQTDQGNACGGCHADGEYGFFANPTSQTMFDQQRTAAGISSFFQVGAAGTTPEVLPAIDTLRSKCSGANLHPACAVDDQYVEYLRRFHQLTRANMAAGLCDEPGYFDPAAPPPAP